MCTIALFELQSGQRGPLKRSWRAGTSWRLCRPARVILCYQLPAIVRGGDGCRIAVGRPDARSGRGVRINGIAAATINSDLSREENVQTWYKVRDGEVRLLYLARRRWPTECWRRSKKRRSLRHDEALYSQWGWRSGGIRHAGRSAHPLSRRGLRLTATADNARGYRTARSAAMLSV